MLKLGKMNLCQASAFLLIKNWLEIQIFDYFSCVLQKQMYSMHIVQTVTSILFCFYYIRNKKRRLFRNTLEYQIQEA